MFAQFIQNQTHRIFHTCIFPLPHIVISEIGISFSITDLVRTKFMLYRFTVFWYIVSMEISITFNSFPKTAVVFTLTRSREGWENAKWKCLVWSGKKKLLYWTTLISPLHFNLSDTKQKISMWLKIS